MTPPDTPPPAGLPPVKPRSLIELYIAFTLLALQGFGGVVAIAQREIVERRRWMTREEFVEEWAVAQILPGPNVVNLSLTFGDRHFGFRGAMVAVAGMLSVPLLVVLALAVLYGQFAAHPAVAGALRGMGAVAAGMIAATGFKMFAALGRHPLGRPLCCVLVAACFAAIGLARLPLLAVLLVLGGASCVLTWRRLTP